MSEFNPSFPESAKPLDTEFLTSVDQNIAELNSALDKQRDAIGELKVQNDIYVKSLTALSSIVKEITAVIPLFTKGSPGIVQQAQQSVGNLASKAGDVLNLVKQFGLL